MRFPKYFSTPLAETTPAVSIKAQMTTPRLNSDIAESTRCTKNDILFAELPRACSKDGLHHLTRTSRQNRKKGIAQLGTGQRLKRQ